MKNNYRGATQHDGNVGEGLLNFGPTFWRGFLQEHVGIKGAGAPGIEPESL
jgi:hypothetical protein